MQVIIFDADGMVITSDIWSVQYTKKTGVTEDVLKPFFKGPFQECLIGKADLKEAITPYLQEWKWNDHVDDLLTFWFEAQSEVDPRMEKKIRSLRKQGVKCVLATNNEKHRTAYLAEKIGFVELFDSIFSSSAIGHKKPSLEFYQHIHDQLGEVEKHEIMFWDDDLKNVTGAKEFGFTSFVYGDFDTFCKSVETHLAK